MYFVSTCTIGTVIDMVVTSWSSVETFISNSGESSIKTIDIFLMPSFWISWFTLLLADQTLRYLSRGLTPELTEYSQQSRLSRSCFAENVSHINSSHGSNRPPGFQRSFFRRYDSTCLSSIGTRYVFRNPYNISQSPTKL